MDNRWLVDFTKYPELHIEYSGCKCCGRGSIEGSFCYICGYRLSWFKIDDDESESYHCRNEKCPNNYLK